VLDPLADKLKVIRATAQAEDVDKQLWLEDVKKLYASVEKEFLAEESQSNAMKFVSQPVQLTDGELGTYWINQLLIELQPGPAFILVPRGMNIVGSVGVKTRRALRGRVDLVNFADRRSVSFYRRFDRTWMFPSLQRPDGVDLTRATFREELAKLL